MLPVWSNANGGSPVVRFTSSSTPDSSDRDHSELVSYVLVPPVFVPILSRQRRIRLFLAILGQE